MNSCYEFYLNIKIMSNRQILSIRKMVRLVPYEFDSLIKYSRVLVSFFSKHDRFTSIHHFGIDIWNIFETILPQKYIFRLNGAYLGTLITSGWTGAFVSWIWLGRGHNVRRDLYSFIKGQSCAKFETCGDFKARKLRFII